jgi:hypothetical protein
LGGRTVEAADGLIAPNGDVVKCHNLDWYLVRESRADCVFGPTQVLDKPPDSGWHDTFTKRDQLRNDDRDTSDDDSDDNGEN